MDSAGQQALAFFLYRVSDNGRVSKEIGCAILFPIQPSPCFLSSDFFKAFADGAAQRIVLKLHEQWPKARDGILIPGIAKKT